MLPGPVSNAITSASPNRPPESPSDSRCRRCSAVRVRASGREQNIIEQRNQRRALSAGHHVGGPKIRNHRHAELLQQSRRLAACHVHAKLRARIALGARLVIERLTVAANQIELHSMLRRSWLCTASAYAMPSRQFSRASSAVEVDLRIHRRQHRSSQRSRIGKRLMGEQLELRSALGHVRAMRTIATSIPSADVPLITPATIMLRGLMSLRRRGRARIDRIAAGSAR